MGTWKIFLAYYTFIVSLVLFIWSIFYAQKPEGFFLTLLIIPINLYFLLLIAGVGKSQSSNSPSENQGTGSKLPQVVLMTLFVSTFSIFVYSEISSRSINSQSPASLSVSKQINSLALDLEKQNKESYEDLIKELGKIKNQLINLKAAQKVSEDAGILGETTVLVGTITISDPKNQTITVYAEKSVSSKIVGKAEFGKNYTFLEKDQDWYLILLGVEEGFIRSQFVKETQQ
ncbi:MAG: hypothetical protein Q8P29_01280 [Candidatus Levybacteria bacterium]|nr:hypothetical protein [Candidatus Levybacteria bacterium]MDZ4228574.1 hypothetical protein [Candidatus Levybacteria bacterium]